MQQIDLLLSAHWIIPVIPRNTVLTDHSLAVHQGRILECLPTQEAMQKYSAEEHRQFPRHALMPGFVNAHAHSPMNLFRGLADDLPLMDWLTQHIWPAEAALINEETVALGSQLAVAEMIRGGTTCFNDHYFFPDVTRDVVIAAGLRASLGHLILNVPTKWASDEDTYFAKAIASLKHQQHHDRIHWMIAPHSPYGVSEAGLIRSKTLASEWNLPIHMHVHETQAEIEQSLAQYGKRPLARLKTLGLLSQHFLAVHMTQLLPEEIASLGDTSVHIIHCPESNLKLASGFAPIAQCLQHNNHVALGTDGAASNNDLDMLGELRTAAFIAKACNGDPTVLPAYQALEMATINGARALGLEQDIGSLEVGKAADCIAIELAHYLTEPVYNPIAQIVYSANRLQISDVFVAGRTLLNNGQLTTLSTDHLQQAVQNFVEKARPFASQASRLTPSEIA